MTAKTKLTQGLIAGAVAIAFAGGGLAIAQSSPPTTGPNPATASGQQSSQATPMGTTGTPGGSNMNNTQTPMTGSTNNMGTTGAAGSTSPSGSNDTLTNTPVERDAQADRN
jgi:hypothetical protein